MLGRIRHLPDLSFAFIGLVLLATGIGLNAARCEGGDFVPAYILARSLFDGTNIYEVEGRVKAYAKYTATSSDTPVFYPPATGVALLPLGILSYPAANAVWFCARMAILLWGVWQLTVCFAPDWKPGRRIMILGLVSCSAVVRWGFSCNQAAPLVLGLIGLYIHALHHNHRSSMFVLALIGLCLKFTLSIPFIGLALLHRRFGQALALFAVFFVINTVGFVRLGGSEAAAGYQRGLAAVESQDVNNPDPWSSRSLVRIDATYTANLVYPNNAAADLFRHLLTVFVAGWICWHAWRVRLFFAEPDTTAAFLAPLVALGLVSVYHHHYDGATLLAPVIVFCCHPFKREALIPWFVVPVVIYFGLYALSLQWYVQILIGYDASILVKALGSYVVLGSLATSLVMLNRYVISRRITLYNGAAVSTTERIATIS